MWVPFGIAPSFDLSPGKSPPTIGIPVRFGVGWDNFYGPGTSTAVYGSAGLAYSHPFTIGSSHWTARAQIIALVRDDTVRRLGSDDAENSTIVPLATLGVSLGY